MATLEILISNANDAFGIETGEVLLMENTGIFDEFISTLHNEVKTLRDETAADRKVVATDKATVNTLKGQTQTLKDQTQTLKTQVDTAKASVDATLAAVNVVDKEIHDHLAESTALKDESTKQAGIATAQATKSQQQATIATTQANTATTQANNAKAQADAAKKYLDDFKANPGTTGDLNVGGVLKVKGVDIATIYETKTDAAQKLTDGKAYTDAELAKLRATDQATLDTLKKINAELATGGSIIDSIQTNKVEKSGDTMTGGLKIESALDSPLTLNCTDTGPHYISFQRSGDNRFFIRQTTVGNIATDSFEFLSGVKDASNNYICPLRINSTGVYSNTAQNAATNALTRKDYVDAEVKKVNDANLSLTGGTMTGTLKINVPSAVTLGGTHSIELTNGSIAGVNYMSFADPTEVESEGIMFPKTGKNDQSTVQADYDNLRALDGSLLFNNKKAYGEWNKPLWADVEGNDFIKKTADYNQVVGWLKSSTTATGFLPAQQGTAGTSSLGTSSWWFAKSYINEMNARILVMNTAGIRVDGEDIIFSV